MNYLIEHGKKAASDLDQQPAKYPPDLDLTEELKERRRGVLGNSSKKRKRLTFDEVSNIILAGVGNGPLRSGKELEAAARQLKKDGNVQL